MDQEQKPILPNSSPSAAPLPVGTPHGSTGKKVAIGGVIVLIILAAGLGYYLSRPGTPPTPGGTVGIPGTGTPGGLNPETPTETPTPPQIPGLPTVQNEADYQVSGWVDWQNPVETSPAKIFDPEGSGDPTSTTYKVGTFTGGLYQGGEIIVDLSSDGPGTVVTRAVKQGQQYTVLAKYSDPFYTSDYAQPNGKYKIDKDFTLSDLELPLSVHGPLPRQNLTLYVPYPTYELFKVDEAITPAFVSPKLGQFYMAASPAQQQAANYYLALRQGFYVRMPDGSFATYAMDPDFFDETGKVPQISWSDGSKNTQEYLDHDIGGCGSYNLTAVVTKDLTAADLQASGKNNKGDDIFLLKDSHHPMLQDLYDNSYYFPEGQTKASYEDFLKTKPLFFWYDPFGRLVRFKNAQYQPLAECAKPVIYLYPTQRQEVRVNLWPQGGWLKSEPAYNQGWDVIADPDGTLTNLSDLQKYPYLFWEGRGGLYETPQRGFVVAQADVSSFLDQKLRQLGLNEKETTDFKDFWLPKMQDAPYYFVTFMGNSTMDQIAPLAINPKPDTTIRILMDFKPLQHPIAVQGYNIQTPQRRGFTVVEWGGVIH